MSSLRSSRRDALARAAVLMAAPFARAQNSGAQSRRKPPVDELVNLFEFEEVAGLTLPSAAYTAIAGGDRMAVDRITFRPRMCVPTVDLDLTVDIFGKHFTPLIVGPIAEQRQYYPDGELATVRGASAAQVGVILTGRSSVPIREIAAAARIPLWYSVYADGNPDTPTQIQEAVGAGCTVVCITLGGGSSNSRASSPSRAWDVVDQLRKAVHVPIVIKGVMTSEDAHNAIAHGARAMVVSNHGETSSRAAAPLDVLPSIVDAVQGKATVLVDGSFRRGSDVLKALILGAQGVLVARPVMWGLAAYGAEGVQAVLQMLQGDLARQMGAIGARSLESLNRDMLRIHRG